MTRGPRPETATHAPAPKLVMKAQRIAAFADGARGGNPTGVVIAARMPGARQMQRTAAEVGFSGTAFAASARGGWRVRCFSPEAEILFCGHATIALGAARLMPAKGAASAPCA